MVGDAVSHAGSTCASHCKILTDDVMDMVKSAQEITLMRTAGRILAGVMDTLAGKMHAGMHGEELDATAEEMIRAAGCIPVFKGYGDPRDPFPGTICLSVNDEIVHGFPAAHILAEGDVVKVDVGLSYQGYCADMARTFIVGQGTADAQAIVVAVRETFYAGLSAVRAGATLYDYAAAAQKAAEQKGFSVVKNLVGHGIGQQLHEAPSVPNYITPQAKKIILRAGMTLALEPMINAGTEQTRVADDGWTYCTVDGALSAHYENTVLVTARGADILTVAS